MGAVYRAIDQSTGQLVAVKELHGLAPGDGERFSRECAFLASLDEPGIVRYVAHGSTEGGTRFLAMEWVDGPTVSDEMKRRSFRVRESVELVTALATIVSRVHKRGIVHRDIKPSNVVLERGDHRRPKLLDFGVARVQGDAGGELTGSGLVVGTAGYLSPEQATGKKDIDARADVFALGCLLFKCVTGRVPFRSDDPLGALLKLTLEDAPRLRDVVPTTPRELDDLVARMLARDRDDRPRDAAQVASLLSQIPVDLDDEAPPSIDEGVITGAEQRLAILVLARTDRLKSRGAPPPPRPDRVAVERAVCPLGLTADIFADGTVVVVATGAGGPIPDVARSAARAACALRAAVPSLFVAVVAGRAASGGAVKIGETVDRASDLLTHLMLHGEPGDVAVDATVASFVDSLYELDLSGSAARLLGERADSGLRSVFGRRSASVGRERDLAFVRGLFDRTVEEGTARAALVIGEPGAGKSRLCHDLVAGLDRFAVEVWLLRGDRSRSQVPFGALAPLLAALAGFEESDAGTTRWKKLASLVDASAPGAGSRAMLDVLAELCGISRPEGRPPKALEAARRDPALMGELLRRGLSDFVAAVASARPLFIAVEDVERVDAATVAFLESAVVGAASRPVFVLALARPEVKTTYPSLLSRCRLQTLHLDPLSAQSVGRLAAELLGTEGDRVAIERIVARAGGNPFFVEELTRATLAGRGASLPDSILALLEARFESLAPASRRILRAASVFGGTFWEGGVKALVPKADVGAELAALEREGLIARARRTRLKGHAEHAFRHELLVEAAYAQIPEVDRKKAHRLVARWLESAGERDPIVLAEHYERGGEGQPAVGLFAVAADLALESSDLAQAVALCDRGLACGAFGEERGRLHVTCAEAMLWLGRAPEALAHARDAMARLAEGEPSWCAAAAIASSAAGRLGDVEALGSLAERALSAPAREPAGSERIVMLARAAIELVSLGSAELADKALSEISQADAQRDDLCAGWFFRARGLRALANGDPCGFGMLTKRSAASFDRAGDVRNACVQRVNVAHASLAVGQFEDALEALLSVLEVADGLGLAGVVASAKLNVAIARAGLGCFDEAEADARDARAAFTEQRDERLAAVAGAHLARILIELRRPAEAEAVAREALAIFEGRAAVRALLWATLGQCLTRGAREGGRAVPPEALRAIGDAEASINDIMEIDGWRGYVRWSIADVLWQANDRADAARALTEAKHELELRAERISVEAQRESFLSRIPEHATTAALYAKLTGA
jgi:tetratricopeptide (TPR) repeat protein